MPVQRSDGAAEHPFRRSILQYEAIRGEPANRVVELLNESVGCHDTAAMAEHQRRKANRPEHLRGGTGALEFEAGGDQGGACEMRADLV